MITTSIVEYEVADIELDHDHTVVLGTVEADKNFFARELVLRFTEPMTGLVQTVSVSVGSNPGADNVMGALALGVLGIQDDAARLVPIMTGGALVGAVVGAQPGGTDIKLKVNHTAGNGGKVTASLIGFIDPI